MTPKPFAERNGWQLYACPALSAIVDGLRLAVRALHTQGSRGGDSRAVDSHPKMRLLERIRSLMLDEIPRNPNAAEYQLGNTMGPRYRHWRRAKFLGRFRLFFRFNTTQKAIVYAWVNDENTLRKAGSATDPYAVFTRKLNAGDPPDVWEDLLRSTAN